MATLARPPAASGPMPGSRLPASVSRAVRNAATATATATGRSVMLLQDDSVFVAAVAENQLREVGIALLNTTSPTLTLASFSDSHRYDHTLNKLRLYQPSKLVVSRQLGSTNLNDVLRAAFPDTELVVVSRKYFNETNGSLCVKQLALKATSVPSDSTMYLALGAAAAVLKYVDFAMNLAFAAGSLRIELCGCSGAITLDYASIVNLELITNARTHDTKHSLYGVINHTKTSIGARLLRINLCQPPNDQATIETRLNCVEELVEKERMFFSITAVLPRVGKLDSLLASLVQLRRDAPTVVSARKDISGIIQLKQTLAIVPLLHEALDGCANALFVALRDNLASPSIQEMQREIDRVIEDDTNVSKSAQHMRMQQCFAVKAGINGLLDVARRAYSETIEDIHQLYEQDKRDMAQPKLKLAYGAKRGYHYSLVSVGTSLPRAAIKVARQGKTWTFSTESLWALNTRQAESLNEILLLAARVLEELRKSLRQHLATMYKINDAIAMLDMLTSFAAYVSLNDPCVRPSFTHDGPLVIKEGRHPVMARRDDRPFMPNDSFISDACNFQIITGPNMSGKSTYLRQVALLVLLAHLGCYVPARFCSVRLTDRIFTRIGTGDSIENNASSFMVEMTEMAYILQNVTDSSLVIIDELGRATSTSDGRAIAWSIAEQLVARRTHTLFATHMPELVHLEQMYANVTNHHLMVDARDDKLVYHYQIGAGSSGITSYGIQLAALAGFPVSVLATAEELRQVLERHKASADSATSEHARLVRAAYELVERLKALARSPMSDTAIHSYLQQLQQSYRS